MLLFLDLGALFDVNALFGVRNFLFKEPERLSQLLNELVRFLVVGDEVANLDRLDID